jgi:thiamine biosynthesis protein ThiS
MKLTINGQKKHIEGTDNLTQLLEQLQLSPQRVVVELNGSILTTDQHHGTVLQEGDTLELVQFVGGG